MSTVASHHISTTVVHWLCFHSQPCPCPFRRTYFPRCSLTKICLFHHCIQSKWNVTAALQPPALNCVTVSVRRRNRGMEMQRSESSDLMWTVQENIPNEPDGSLCSWGRMSPTTVTPASATANKKNKICVNKVKSLCSVGQYFIYFNQKGKIPIIQLRHRKWYFPSIIFLHCALYPTKKIMEKLFLVDFFTSRIPTGTFFVSCLFLLLYLLVVCSSHSRNNFI